MNSDFPLALIQKCFFAWVKVEMKTISNKDKNFCGTYILQTYWLLEMICYLSMELKSMHTIWIVKWRLRMIGKFETLSYLQSKRNNLKLRSTRSILTIKEVLNSSIPYPFSTQEIWPSDQKTFFWWRRVKSSRQLSSAASVQPKHTH